MESEYNAIETNPGHRNLQRTLAFTVKPTLDRVSDKLQTDRQTDTHTHTHKHALANKIVELYTTECGFDVAFRKTQA